MATEIHTLKRQDSSVTEVICAIRNLVEKLNSKQITDNDYRDIAKTLLGEVTEKYIDCIPEEDLYLFDEFFLSCASPIQSLSCLLGALQRNNEKHVANRVVDLLRKYFTKDSLKNVIFKLQASMSEAESLSFITQLLSTPDRVFNTMHQNTPEEFSPTRFFPNICSSLLGFLSKSALDSRNPSFHWLAIFVDRLVLLGQTKVLTQEIVNCLNINSICYSELYSSAINAFQESFPWFFVLLRCVSDRTFFKLMENFITKLAECSWEGFQTKTVPIYSSTAVDVETQNQFSDRIGNGGDNCDRSCINSSLLLCTIFSKEVDLRPSLSTWLCCKFWIDKFHQDLELILMISSLFLMEKLDVFEEKSLLKEENGFLSKICTSIIPIWSDSSFLQHSSLSHQRFLSRVVEQLLHTTTVKRFLSRDNSIVPFLFEGIQLRMASNVEQIRVHGMRVAEAFALVSKSLTESIPDNLQFDRDAATEEAWDSWEWQFSVPLQNREHQQLFVDSKKITENDQKKIAVEFENESQEIKRTRKMNDCIDEKVDITSAINSVELMFDPDEPVIPFQWIISNANNTIKHSNMDSFDSDGQNSDEKSDADSDDSFEPYLGANAEKENEDNESKALSFPRDCLDGLMMSIDNHPDKVKNALRNCSKVVYSFRDSKELENVAPSLCKILFNLHHVPGMDDFDQCRIDSLVALCLSCTSQASKILIEEFYAENHSISQRLDVLFVLSQCVRELSAPPQSSKNEPSVQSQETPSITNENPSKTRRFIKHKPKTPITFRNRFSPYSSSFFFPLARYAINSAENRLHMLSHTAILRSLLATLALFVQAAGKYDASIVAMSTSLLAIALSVRFHPQPDVRSSCLAAISTAFSVIPNHNALELLEFAEKACLERLGNMHLYTHWASLNSTNEHDLPKLDTNSFHAVEFRQWLENESQEDPDSDCRSLATMAITVISRIFKL